MFAKPNLPKNAGAVDWAGPECHEAATSGLVHCIRLPDKVRAKQLVPVVVMLHGWGGDEGSMWLFKHVPPTNVAIVTPRAPLDVGNGGYAWFFRDDPLHLTEPESLLTALAKLEDFLASLPRLYPVDPARLLLIGFSQGAAIINSLVMARPELVMAVALLSGMGFELPELIPQAMSLAGLPVFIAHGTRDETVPLSAAQKACERYKHLGAKVTYAEYEVGHKMHVNGIKDLKAWVANVINPQR
ncbi:MAG: alpha/beta fold hydrolase [Anaerolineae bacterium]|nr:alpha/beta fold hydrolase [Anaerolineae bacterium]